MKSRAAITIDVEWAHPEVLDYVVRELDSRNLRATFFCTHAGIELRGHERALHPNYRRYGNSLLEAHPEISTTSSELSFYELITTASMAFCPEAVGVRSHHLFWEAGLGPICKRAGLRYTSNTFQPLAEGLKPVTIACDLTELPIYYMDHWDLTECRTSFHLNDLRLETEGLKVLDFHPNLIFINARSSAQYNESKRYYHDPAELRKLRSSGRGIQTLFLELLDALAIRSDDTMLLKDILTLAV